MPVKIEQPYPVFRDKIGLPLDGGLIYIGVAGLNPETNPIQCYFDEDFTLLAPQPLRTINGYISRNGSPANIFLKFSECSITIKDRFRITQYTDLHFQLSNFGQITSDSIFDESGLSQQKVNNGLESIAELLDIQNPKDGNRQFVKSYYAGGVFGGGDFYYDSSKASINNGVTIFNGWVRILNIKVLTSYDAGLINDSTSTQRLFDAIEDGMVVEIHHKLKANKSIEIPENTNGCKIIGFGDGSISASSDFVFGSNGVTAKRGVIFGENTPSTEILDLKIVGCQKYNSGALEPFQDGDSGIQFISSPNSLVKNCDISHTYAWGVVAENSPNSSVIYNNIYNITRQSGVNIVVGGGYNCDVSFNNIYDVGLYGVEWETANTGSYDNKCLNNTISDCYAGILNTRQIDGVTSSGNILSECGYSAIFSTKCDSSTSMIISSNTVYNCFRFAVIDESKHSSVFGNIADGIYSKDVYLKANPNYSILSVIDSHNFLIHKDAITATGTVYFNNTSYNVTAIALQPDTIWGLGQVAKITVSQTIDSGLVNKHKQNLFTSGSFCEAGITLLNESTGSSVSANEVSGYNYSLYSDSASTSATTISMNVRNNIFKGANIYDVLQDKDIKYIYLSNNNLSRSPKILINQSVFNLSLVSGCFLSQVENRNANDKNNIKFYLDKPATIIGATFMSIGSISSTGNIALLIDNVDYAIGVGVSDQNISAIKTLSSGAHTLKVLDTVGDLSHQGWIVRLFTM